MTRLCRTNLIGLLSVFCIVGCASYQVSTYDAVNIKTINTWHLRLTRELEIIENALNQGEEDNFTSKESILLRCDLQLRDGIASYLKSKYKIILVDDPTAASGFIRIQSVCQWGYYVTLEITVYDREENLLAQIEAQNGEDIFVKDDDEFAEYCADAIAEAISHR